MQTRQLKTRALLVNVLVPATNSGRLNPPKVDGKYGNTTLKEASPQKRRSHRRTVSARDTLTNRTSFKDSYENAEINRKPRVWL